MKTGTTGTRSLRRAAGAVCWTLAVVGAMLAGTGVAAASNTSDPAVTAFTYSPPGSGSGNQPQIVGLLTGPDGALWFAWQLPMTSVAGLGRITSSGGVSVFAAPSGWVMTGLATGGGSLWVSERHDGQSFIGQWSTSGTLVHDFPVAGTSVIRLAWGPDAALWFTGGDPEPGGVDNGLIGQMTTAGVTTVCPLPRGPQGLFENGGNEIIAGPDGALWFDLPAQGAIGRMSVSGSFTLFPLGGSPSANFEGDQSIAVGPDGSMWAASGSSVKRVTATGGVTTYAVPQPESITSGPNGNVSFLTVALASQAVGLMSTAGHISASYPLPAGGQVEGPQLTVGPDGKLWIGGSGQVDQLDPSIASPTPPPTSPTPVSSQLTLSTSQSNCTLLATANSGSGGGAPDVSPGIPTPVTGATATPVSGFLNTAIPNTATSGPGAAHGRLASAAMLPSTPLPAILIGALTVAGLAAGGSLLIIRRRRGARAADPPTP